MWKFVTRALDAGARVGLVMIISGVGILALEGLGQLSLEVDGYPWVRSAVVGWTALGGAIVAVATLFLLFDLLHRGLTYFIDEGKSRAEVRAVDEEALANVKITDDDERQYLITQFRRNQDRFSTDHWDYAIEGLQDKRIIDHPTKSGSNVWAIRPCVWKMRDVLMSEWSHLPDAPPWGLTPKAARRSRFGGY